MSENRKRAEYGFGEYGFKHRTQWVSWGSLSSGERTQWVPFSLLFVCQSELTEFLAELTEFAPKLSEAQWVLFSETVPSKQYSVRFLEKFWNDFALRLFPSSFCTITSHLNYHCLTTTCGPPSLNLKLEETHVSTVHFPKERSIHQWGSSRHHLSALAKNSNHKENVRFTVALARPRESFKFLLQLQSPCKAKITLEIPIECLF